MAFNVVERIPDAVQIRHVLIIVFDKTGLRELVTGLMEACPDVRFYSTGGTFRRVAEVPGAADRLTAISEITGQPEMQGGLVKTLDFSLYLGLLSEPYNDDHDDDIRRTGATVFDAVIVNLYPFSSAIEDPDVSVETARGNIDIGGPTMLRAGAKNFIRVASVCDPADYSAIVEEARADGGRLGVATRFRLAQKVFSHTAAYDTAIARFLSSKASADLPYHREHATHEE